MIVACGFAIDADAYPAFSRRVLGPRGRAICRKACVQDEVEPELEVVSALCWVVNSIRFAVGNEAFGIAKGSFTEFAAAKESKLAHKPQRIAFEQAAVSAISGITALQALTTIGRIEPSRLRRALTPTSTLVLVCGENGGRVIGRVRRQLRAAMLSPFISQRLTFFVSEESVEDIAALAEYLATGDVSPMIGQRFALDEVQGAVGAFEAGTLTGKTLITVTT